VRTGGVSLGSNNTINEGNSAFGAVPPPSPGFPSGLVFAKRKRSPFKGPMLNVTTQGSPAANGGWRRTSDGQGSRSQSIQGRRSGEGIMGITEEEEEEEDEEEVEEVDDFGSAGLKEGEFVEDLKGPATPPKDLPKE
jgi:hypothetical protein